MLTGLTKCAMNLCGINQSLRSDDMRIMKRHRPHEFAIAFASCFHIFSSTGQLVNEPGDEKPLAKLSCLDFHGGGRKGKRGVYADSNLVARSHWEVDKWSRLFPQLDNKKY